MLNIFMKIPFYVYKITLISTGQFYYGSRTANVRFKRLPKDDLWKYYFTSSNSIKRLIRDIGKDSFSAEVIYESNNAIDVYWFEQSNIKEHIHNPQCLNKKFQDKISGNTIFSTTGKPSWNKGIPSSFKGIPRSPQIVEKIRQNRKGKGLGIIPKNKGKSVSEEQRNAQSQKMKGRFTGEKNHFFGKSHSPEVKKMIAENTSKHMKGRPKMKSICPHCGYECSVNTMPSHIRFKHAA